MSGKRFFENGVGIMAKEKEFARGRWSSEEIKVLEQLYPSKGPEEIANKLGRSIRSTRGKANRMGLKTIKYHDWSADEVKLLKKIFPCKRTEEVADQIGRSWRSVVNKAHQLGLKKIKRKKRFQR